MAGQQTQSARPSMSSEVLPGAIVRHPQQPDWGLGQVQSVIGNRITVNFENAGKVLVNGELIHLIVVQGQR